MLTNPLKNLKALGLREDHIVADLGAGTGFYSIALGHLVPKGKVYAVEIQRDFLMSIKHKSKEAYLPNIEIIWGDIEKPGGTKIGDGVVDAVIASNVLFQLEYKDRFIHEIKRILKVKGKVLLVDWSLASLLSANKVIPKHKARTMFENKGFTFERDVNVGEHHYGMIIVKN